MSRHDHERRSHRFALSADEAPSEGVYSGVAAVEDCSPLDLTPLATVVEPEALDALLSSGSGAERITFRYCGYEVTATRDDVCLHRSEP